MTLTIKNMVCPRCIMAVTSTLANLGLTPDRVALGEAHIREELDKEGLARLEAALQTIGFELIHDRTAHTIVRIKQAIIEAVRNESSSASNSLPTLLSSKLHTEYTNLSRTFAAAEGRTIEKYFLLQRLEYVKELLEYGELTVKEIAYRTGFANVAHLSRQFKQLTGLTPTEYRDRRDFRRDGLDKI